MGSRASELQLQGLDLFTKPMEECPKIGHPFEDLTTDDPEVKGNLVCASKVKECEDVVLHLHSPTQLLDYRESNPYHVGRDRSGATSEDQNRNEYAGQAHYKDLPSAGIRLK